MAPVHTVKICRHLTTKRLTTLSSEENEDKHLSVDDKFVIGPDDNDGIKISYGIVVKMTTKIFTVHCTAVLHLLLEAWPWNHSHSTRNKNK